MLKRIGGIATFIIILMCGHPASNADTPSESSGWTMFRGRPEHTGKTSLIGPPEECELKWRWRVYYDSAPISASPVLSLDNTNVYCATEGGYLAALNMTQNTSWLYPVDGPVLSTPAIDAQSNILAITQDGYIYLLSGTGELQWKCDLGIGIISSPVLSGTTAYVGTNSNGLFAITLNPNMTRFVEDSKRLLKWDILLWSFLTQGGISSSPTFAGNTVFVAGGTKLYALNPDEAIGDNMSARIKWFYDVHSSIQSSAAVYNGVVYIGDDNGYLYAFRENVESGSQRGEIIWKRKLGGSVRSSPAINTPAAGETDTKEVIYIGSDDGKIYAISEQGDLLWTFSTLGPVRSSPVIDGNGDIYFGSDDGAIYALYPDGSLKWKYQTGGKVRSSPAIGTDNMLYVGSDDGFLYCIGKSTRENREYELTVDISLSLASIENDGNPTTIAAKVSSTTEGKDVLSRIASVTIDLSRLNLIGVLSSSDPLSGLIDIGTIGIEQMADDGLYEDDVAGDGIFTYAFGLTDDPTLIGWDEGIYTHYPALGPVGVGPVPIMVTVTDLYGNKTSKPFALVIDQKMRGVPPFEDSLISLLNNQSLTVSFTSGTPSILSITPAQGAPGQRVNITIVGKNTNFTKNRTRIEIFNNAGIVIASALPENDDVDVLSDTLLNAVLSITNNEQIKGGLVGNWDVTVTTEFPEGGVEVVIGKKLFAIGTIVSNIGTAMYRNALLLPEEEQTCQFRFDIMDDLGARPKGAPFSINIGYPRTITIDRARSGVWNYNIQLNGCTTIPSFKIITRGGNFGYLTGQVRNGINGNGIDNATISALTGEQTDTPVNKTISSGGGYYLLPLAASEKTYTVVARKGSLVDVHREIAITDGKETNLNFSLKPEIGCPIADLAQPDMLPLFYHYRDNILAQTSEGRQMVTLYYRFASELQCVLNQRPDLAQRFSSLIEHAAHDLIYNGQKFRQETIQEFLVVLSDIALYGSNEMRQEIANNRKRLVLILKTLKDRGR
ncbi:MAG: PQQ-binding-like beta-propeller repeat protein [Desulfobacterota bacterium]|nr:PQQ-binding-like beta-propeller repeat protein [Thermodesulfobacteriota bacterium]